MRAVSIVLLCVRLMLLIGLLLVCVLLPFFPGRFDPLAVTVSNVVQFLGFAGVLLVPLGVAWLVHEARRRTRRGQGAPGAVGKDRGFPYALLYLCAGAPIAALALLGVSLGGSHSLALGASVLCVYVFWRLARRLGRLRKADRAPTAVPLYLTLVPVAVMCARLLLLEPAVASSRNRAIQNSAGLIAEIEAYRTERGSYPSSLAALHQDYDPGVIGVEQYGYQPRGAAYSVFFEQPASPLGTREIVMFNKLDDHAFPSHDSDLLRWTPEEQAARPGHYSLRDAPSPHWKYFWFD